MSTAAIIAEYNPFHTGHLYQIDKVREITGAENIVIVMSGNYVQRGIPAVFDKYTRTHMALTCGCDAVFELPVFYSTGSAEYFASGAVNLVASLGCANYLCFGCETENIDLIKDIAGILISEPSEYKNHLQDFLKSGMPFAKSRIKALLTMFKNEEYDEVLRILSSPNSILAIEYVKAILKNNYNIKPVIIRRDYGYHSDSLTEKFASASGIRKSISTSSVDAVKDYIPEQIWDIFTSALPVSENDFSDFLFYKILFADSLEDYLDVNKFLANSINNNQKNCKTFNGLTSMISGKHITTGRCNRALIHIMLDITTADINSYIRNNYNRYIRMLGFRKSHSSLLSAIKQNSSLPVISKMSDSGKLLDDTSLSMLKHNIRCDDLYNFVLSQKYNLNNLKNEYTTGMIVYD